MRGKPNPLIADEAVATLEVIAQELGLTRERCRQIEAQALQKCRVALEAKGYRLEDLIGEAGPPQGLRGRRIHRSD